MTVKQLTVRPEFSLLNAGNDMDLPLSRVFCCDLLSVCMSRASAGCAWVTVMGNVNSVAVAVLTDTACIVLAEQTSIDDAALEKAKQQGVTVLRTALPSFEAAKLIDSLMHNAA